MRLFHKVPLRFRSLVRMKRVEQELDDELKFHIETQAAKYIAKGLQPEEARYRALRELGGVGQIKEECRDARRVTYVESLLQDVRYGLRMLAKHPSFTITAVLTLALGIGANTAIFSALKAVLLKHLPYRDADRLVTIWLRNPHRGWTHNPISKADFISWRKQTDVFADIALMDPKAFALTRNNSQPEESRANK